jgi:nucleoporin POM152
LPATPEPFRIADIFSPFYLFSDAPRGDQHLLGQHTVRMSPISTAHLNPDAFTFCLSPPSDSVLIPILVNNTTPANVRYSFTPLTYIEGQSGSGRIDHIELGGKDLKAIEQARLEGLQSVRVYSADDEYEEDEDDTPSTSDSQLQKTQSLTHIRVTKPGTIRLERILDSSGVAARLAHPLEVTVVPCPTAYYTDDSIAQPANEVRCQGDTSGVDLAIDIRGVPPLSLRWSKYADGKKESFLVEGIEDSDRSHADSRNVVRTPSKTPQILKVPLSLSLDSLGRVTFVLESVIDGMGNIVPLDQGETLHREVALNSKTAWSLNILRRPSISFRNCGSGNPVSLFIGSDAPLSLHVTDSDPLDAPWNVDVKFDPSEDGKNGGKFLKPWKDTFQTHQSSLSLSASAAGEYTILGIRGKVRT